MQPTTNLLINATRKAAKFLQRDFTELEMLQSSARGTKNFSDQSLIRTQKLLREELSLQFKNIIFSNEKYELPNEADVVLLVTPIEGLDNLSRGLPFFATMITQLKKIQGILTPITNVINFPALSEIYYAEKGSGAWLESFNAGSSSKASRLRSSSYSSLESAFICSPNYKEIEKIPCHIRHFGSYCYDVAALFCSGKADLIYFNSLSPFLNDGFELMIKESGGGILDNNRPIAKIGSGNETFVAASYNLIEKFTQFLAKN